ncbi:MAG: ComEC/Rec2 family competence protein [Terrisporobacter sp.]|uniref:ComEC/Rec2 family competence protein n=1 Tax=Terrisporobacter sp. TaxID=1965305 RepID=UPI002FCBE975
MIKKINTIIIIFLLLFLNGCRKYDNFLCINIIDVGQGDCILVSTPDKKNILIDAGDENSEKIVKSYLKHHKIKKLDVIIATHLDKDHIGSLDYIIDNFKVDKIYTPNQIDNSTHYNNLIKSCKDKNLKINYLSKGDNISFTKDINLSVLSPSYISQDNNPNSIVLNLRYINMDFLFTGDCEESNELDMINSYNLEDVDFLKIAHHGSSSSSTDNFIKEVSPTIGVISCGYKNQYGHPHKSTLDTLRKYSVATYRTDHSGDLVFYCDGNKIFTTKKYNQTS